jgi:hypothetical protein
MRFRRLLLISLYRTPQAEASSGLNSGTRESNEYGNSPLFGTFCWLVEPRLWDHRSRTCTSKFHTPHSLDTYQEFLHPQEDQPKPALAFHQFAIYNPSLKRAPSRRAKIPHRHQTSKLLLSVPVTNCYRGEPFHQACYILYAQTPGSALDKT